MEVTLFTPLLAFAAGLLSCLSPCVLPLLPAYMGNLSGAVAGSAEAGRSRTTVMAHALTFVLGFSLVFIVLGVSVGFVGYVVRDQQDLMRKVGGIFMIAMGLQLAGIIRIPGLERTYQPIAESSSLTPQRVGYVRSLGLGSAMGVGWTPCIGPTLGGILTLAATSGTAWTASGLLLAYSAGLAVPFLVAGFAIDRVQGLSLRLRPMMPFVSIVSGLILIFAGAVIYTNALAQFNRYFTVSGLGANI